MSAPDKGKLPWMKFFSADWRADPVLRICSLGARGLWMEMLCLMHEAEPYGHLISRGNPISNHQLAVLAGVPEIEVAPLLAELEAQGVFSRNPNTVIYSRRMTRDFRKRERDAENGKLGGNPKLKRRVNPGVKPRVKAQRPDTKGQMPKSSSHNAELVTPESDREREPSLSGELPPKVLDGKVPFNTRINPDWKPSEAAIAASIDLGMTRDEIDTELRKFILRHKEKGTLSMDWNASWGSWCERWKEFNPTRAVSLTIVGMPKKFHVKEGTPQWTAWSEHLGKSPPMDRQFGWWFGSEWPPGHEPEPMTEGAFKKLRSTQ